MSSSSGVSVWQETVVIPTYGVGAPDSNPMFLDKRVYQGSSGAVYPYPIIDKVEDHPQDQPWGAIFLENEFLKVMVLPQLGGRVQMALDKTNDYHFIYYNRVIKPALVGLAGPWISGGIEFNWPQHHRPNTFGPVAHQIERHETGACTVWCSEIDRMNRTKGMHGLTLHPDWAVLEVKVKLYNRTSLPQTFLWWANPAIHVDDNHQSVFPSDVHAVMDHGKRDSISFPIAKGEYYKIDYSPGTDISRYRNIPVPTSYMAYHSEYDFVGSYDHRRQAGMVHVCDHQISPGKKQWTWGHGDFGKRWDRHLTDEDGPYIELMCGVYTDNQPDFSWLMPSEEKGFSQYFMPYKGVGMISNATTEAVVGMECKDREVQIRAYTTRIHRNAKCELVHGQELLFREAFDGSPHSSFEAKHQLATEIPEHELLVRILDENGDELVSFQSSPDASLPVPEPAEAIQQPTEIDSVESLYLAARHLEQYRHATREAADYYLEALRRDPGDYRCNTALATLLINRGCFAAAEVHARRAIERITRHNPNPFDGEAHYVLGVACEFQGKYGSAMDAYQKSTWNQAHESAAKLAIARLLCRQGNLEQALQETISALEGNSRNRNAQHLEIVLLRLLKRTEKAKRLISEALSDDPFNRGVLWEQSVIAPDSEHVGDSMASPAHDSMELAIEYAACGLYDTAIDILSDYVESTSTPSTLALYHRAFYLREIDRCTEAKQDEHRAASAVGGLCFPNRLEDIAALRSAISHDAKDSQAHYCLGNLLYDKRHYDSAIGHWEATVARDRSNATAWRNLGLAYFNKRGNGEKAWQAYTAAFKANSKDGRILFEIDQLAKRLRHFPAERLERLSQHQELVSERDDLSLEYATLLNLLARYDEALSTLLSRNFHPWEGGEGKVSAQFVLSLTSLAHDAIRSGRPDDAIALLMKTEKWPESLGEGKLSGIQENDINYLFGMAFRLKENTDSAMKYFHMASVGLSEPTSATFYNDQPPEMIYYQGLSQMELGNEAAALSRFERLIDYGNEHLQDNVTIDYFAVSLPDFLVFEDDLNLRNSVHCHFMIALGLLGKGRSEQAKAHLKEVVQADPSHLANVLQRRFFV